MLYEASYPTGPLEQPGGAISPEAESRFRLMVSAVVDYSIFMLDIQGFVVSWNLGAQRIKGYQAHEVIGRHFSIFYPAESVESGLPAHELEVACAQGRCEDEGWRVRKDGSRFWANVVITALREEDGTLMGFGKVTRDLTARRNAEQRIRAAEHAMSEAHNRLSAVLESTSDCIMTMGRDWTLLYANKNALTTLPDIRLGKSYWDCFPSVLSTPAETHLRSAMAQRESIKFENFYEPYERWYRVAVYPSSDGLSVFFGDITEEKKIHAQLELEQVLREKRIEALSHMAGGLAHEISNPLAVIHATASDLASIAASETSLSAEEVLKSADRIVRTTERAIRILRGLRGFGREAGKDPFEFASIYEIADQCAELQQTRLERHQVALRLNLRSGIPYILCRETQVGQIITNLINNAFDAIVHAHPSGPMPPEPNLQERWIELHAECVGSCVQIDVTDSGPGIEEKFRPHLLEAFFTTKEQGQGMGIGLSLSRAIAQDHGGTLALLDNTVHTSFRLTLPIDPSPNGSNPHPGGSRHETA